MEKFLNDLFANQSYDETNFFLIAGPCVVESEELIMEVAEKVSGICKNLGIPYIFKASYRKANRTSANSFSGIGNELALGMIKNVKQKFNINVFLNEKCIFFLLWGNNILKRKRKLMYLEVLKQHPDKL